MFKDHLAKGYGYAYMTVFLWAMYNIIAKLAVVFHVHPAIFVAVGSFASATALLVYAGHGRLSFDALTKPHTIFYAALNLMEHLFTLYLFMYVAGSEGSLMQRLNIAFAMLIALFLSRKPSKLGLLGLIITQIGVFGIISQIDPTVKYQAIAWLIVVVFCQTSKTFISETHPPSNNAKNHKEHARVTAFVTFVSSVIFFAALLAMAAFREVGAVTGEIAMLLPQFSDFIHPATFLMALVFGVLNDAPAGYCYFYATKKVKSENFFAVAALVPLFTYGIEYLLQFTGIIKLHVFGMLDWAYITFIMVGSIAITFSSSKKEKVFDDRQGHKNSIAKDRLTATLVQFDHDITKAAEALNIPENDFRAIHDNQRIATPEELEYIRDSFENNIKDRDPVTGLDNRLTFLTQMDKLEQQQIPFVLLFLDLNKFKPINDTYGHEAGDFVLKEIAKRLEANYAHVAAITRIGGDEFCIMFFDYKKDEVQEFIPEVKALIAQPMYCEIASNILSVNSAIGCAAYPEDASTGKELLKMADELMFEDKEGEAR